MKTPSELFDTPPTSGPVFDALASKKILSAIEWLNQEYPHPHGGFVIPSPEMVEAYAAYYHAEMSKPPEDVEAAIEAYEDVALIMYNEQSMGFAEVVSKAVLHGYSLAGNKAVNFLDQIRDYERESGEAICNDERTSEEFYEIFNAPKKENNG